MKKIALVAAAIFFTLGSAQAQSRLFSDLYDQYRKDDQATTVSVTGSLITLAAIFADADDEEAMMLKELGKSIDRIKVISANVFNDPVYTVEELNAIKARFYSEDGFAFLMNAKEGETNMEVMAIEKDGVIEEVLLFTIEDEEVVIVDIVGEIDVKNINQLIESVDMDF